MRPRRRNRITPDEHPPSRPSPEHESPTLPPEPTGTGGPGFVLETVEIRVLSDFLSGPSFRPLLQRGAILLHGKRSYAELTLDALQHGQRRHLRLRRFDGDWRADDASSLSRRPRRPTVVVVDRPSRHEEVVRLLEQRTAADQPSYGTWVLGFIGEFALSQVGLFDAIIMFDTSEDELERLRSVAVLQGPDRAALASSDQALIYVAARPRPGLRFPLPRPNPAIVPISETSRAVFQWPTGTDWKFSTLG